MGLIFHCPPVQGFQWDSLKWVIYLNLHGDQKDVDTECVFTPFLSTDDVPHTCTTCLGMASNPAQIVSTSLVFHWGICWLLIPKIFFSQAVSALACLINHFLGAGLIRSRVSCDSVCGLCGRRCPWVGCGNFRAYPELSFPCYSLENWPTPQLHSTLLPPPLHEIQLSFLPLSCYLA